MERFETVEQLLSCDSSFFRTDNDKKSDRVLKSTKIEQVIYDDLHAESEELSQNEEIGKQKLKSFDSLVNDVFQSIYGITPKFVDDEQISSLARHFNKNILDGLMSDDDYSAIKSICEGKELPAIEATEEFSDSILGNLDELMNKATGGNGKADTLDKLERDRQEQLQKVLEFLAAMKEAPQEHQAALGRRALSAANRALSKQEQAEMFANLIANNTKQNAAGIKKIVSASVTKALERAENAKNVLLSWGDDAGDMQRNPLNKEILKRTAASHKLRYIVSFLGRYKEMLNSKRLAGYAYGRGEKYDLEYGNNISKALTSEMAMLATPELLPLFIKKYLGKSLKQYRRREPEYKGKGDIIVCLDESSSTFGESNAYGMAVAMVLYELCRINHTNFALVHFSKNTKTEIFLKDEQVSPQRIMDCAETFLSGGTNFDNVLREVNILLLDGRFEKPDIVFITDGVCTVSDEVVEAFEMLKADTGAKLTGILLDKSEHFTFSLEKFADEIYRTSKLFEDDIMEKIICERV